jgi:two-component system sensor kinase FixL
LLQGFDVTERRASQQALADAMDRLQLAVRTHSIGIFDTDVVSQRVYWSAELEELFGYAAGSFPAELSAWRSHVLPDDLALIDDLFNKTIAIAGNEVAYAYRIKRLDGELRHIEASAHFFYDAAGTNVRRVGVNIDVTDRKSAERRLVQTEAELIHLSRLCSVGAMSSSLAHELNQPLTAISNCVAAARRFSTGADAGTNEGLLASIDGAAAAAQRASELIQRIRGMTRKDTVLAQDLSLSALIHEAASLALLDANVDGINLEVAVDLEADSIQADPIELQQVLFNLMRNAAEASRESGGKQITVKAIRDGEIGIQVRVEDTGGGIHENVADKIFSPFHSTKPDGMGVGLSICRTIVEKYGGRIWVDSGPTGARFCFTLPDALQDDQGVMQEREA